MSTSTNPTQSCLRYPAIQASLRPGRVPGHASTKWPTSRNGTICGRFTHPRSNGVGMFEPLLLDNVGRFQDAHSQKYESVINSTGSPPRSSLLTTSMKRDDAAKNAENMTMCLRWCKKIQEMALVTRCKGRIFAACHCLSRRGLGRRTEACQRRTTAGNNEHQLLVDVFSMHSSRLFSYLRRYFSFVLLDSEPQKSTEEVVVQGIRKANAQK